jgi:hypothetical protein
MSNWSNDENAMRALKARIIQMGIPLEVRVRQICRQYDRWRGQMSDDSKIEADRYLYRSSDGSLREIDCSLTIEYLIMESPNHLIKFELQILIECKHRDQLILLAFPDTPAHKPSLVTISGSLALTHAGAQIRQAIGPAPWAGPIADIGAVLYDPSIKVPEAGKDPRRFDEQLVKKVDEDLIYKAGASLYDACYATIMRDAPRTAHEFVDKHQLVKHFFQETSHAPFGMHRTIRQWMSQNIPSRVRRKFPALASSTAHISTWKVLVPIICVDAPLYQVTMASDGTPDMLNALPHVMTMVRLAQWPGDARLVIELPHEAAGVLVVTIDQIDSLIETIVQWTFQAPNIYKQVDPGVKEELRFEEAIMQSVIATLRNAH